MTWTTIAIAGGVISACVVLVGLYESARNFLVDLAIGVGKALLLSVLSRVTKVSQGSIDRNRVDSREGRTGDKFRWRDK